MISNLRALFIKGFVSLSIGVLGMLLAFIFNDVLKMYFSETFRGMIFGLFGGLISVGCVFLIVYFIKTRHPLTKKRFEHQLSDERNLLVSQKAALFAMRCLPLVGALFIIVAFAFNEPMVGKVLLLFEYVMLCLFIGSGFYLKGRM